MPHLTRPRLGRRTPVHVTLRMRAGRASLRAEVLRTMFERIVQQTRREDFHVAVYSLQHDHVHMICEPADRAALSAGVLRVAIRFALRMNKLFGRTSGKSWGDRYHRHDLRRLLVTSAMASASRSLKVPRTERAAFTRALRAPSACIRR